MIKLSSLIKENSLRHTGPGIANWSKDQHNEMRKLEDRLGNIQQKMGWTYIDLVNYKSGPDETLQIKLGTADDKEVVIEPWVQDKITVTVYSEHTKQAKVFSFNDVKNIAQFIQSSKR